MMFNFKHPFFIRFVPKRILTSNLSYYFTVIDVSVIYDDGGTCQ